MVSIGSPETSVLNRFTPRNNPEDGIIQFSRGVGLRSRNNSVHVLVVVCPFNDAASTELLLKHHPLISVLFPYRVRQQTDYF